MENNKYIQETMIINRRIPNNFEDKNGNTKYNYTVTITTYDPTKRKYVAKDVIISTPHEHDIKDVIFVKCNKSLKGEFYYTEVTEDDELPF